MLAIAWEALPVSKIERVRCAAVSGLLRSFKLLATGLLLVTSGGGRYEAEADCSQFEPTVALV